MGWRRRRRWRRVTKLRQGTPRDKDPRGVPSLSFIAFLKRFASANMSTLVKVVGGTGGTGDAGTHE